MAAFRLAIFDCDGVLIDSEIIAAEVQTEFLRQEGIEVEVEEFAVRYAGLTWPVILDLVQKDKGLRLAQDFRDRVDAEIDRRLASDVEEIAGAREAIEAVEALGLPRCICSNSSLARLETSLDHVGLLDYFLGHLFPASEVGTQKPKPAPDVFRFACEKFGVEPGETIVIEDSIHGVQAAVAAGCRVVGFTGGRHSFPGHGEALADAGAETVIARLRDYPATVEALAEFSSL